MSEENKNLNQTSAPEAKDDTKKSADKAKKKNKNKEGGLKAFLKSRKARHGSISVAIIAVVIALVVVLNIVFGLLVDRFPNIKLDLTSNNSFALQEDTVDYVSHLNKNVNLYVLMSESDFESQGTYFVQAKNLLEKMVGSSNGKLHLEYVDLASNPTFNAKYPDVDWKSTENNYLILVECGDQYKVLTLNDCFEYDEELASYGQYQFTSTKIEQAVVTAILNVTTEDKVVVDIITGNQEQDYSGIKSLLENNAYDVEEISLITQNISEQAQILVLFAPAVDLDENAASKISQWLDNDGAYGRTFIYVPSAEKVDTPNIDNLLAEWGMEVNGGYVFETNSDYLVSGSTPYAFLVDYTDYYTENLKNAKIPVVTSDAHDIIIKDSDMAHGILVTSDDAGVQPYDADENWNYQDAISGEPLNIAAEGVKTNSDDKSSKVLVFGSYMMFNPQILQFNSYNNSAYFMNVVNTAANKADSGITIESKSLDSAELGVTDVTTKNIMLALFVFIIPICILVTGLVVWLRRRNR